MFGHQDSTNQANHANNTNGANNGDADQSATQPANGILSHPVSPQTFAPTAAPMTADATAASMSADDGSGYVMTGTPAVDQLGNGSLGALAGAPPAPNPSIVTEVSGTVSNTNTAPPTDTTGLLELKQAALHELTPLLDHLEQTAEEKFRTMMMMIQASDDQTMLAEAYEAAQSIEDKKTRAQALLDVVNEINYFTQQHTDTSNQ